MEDEREGIEEYELREIDTASTFRVVFLIALVICAILAVIQIAVFVASGQWEWAGGALLMAPFIAAVEGALVLMIVWLYNALAGRFGGVRMKWRRTGQGSGGPAAGVFHKPLEDKTVRDS